MDYSVPTTVLGVENVAHEPNLVGNVALEPSFEGKMLKEAVFKNGKTDTGAT